ncbi:MAG: c-type cytochrome [Polyangiaceae bacterium]
MARGAETARRAGLWLTLLLALPLGACGGESTDPSVDPPSAPTPPTTEEREEGEAILAEAKPAEPRGDAAHGRELVARFECVRCHEGTDVEPPVDLAGVSQLDAKHCFKCHQDVMTGALDHMPKAAQYKRNVAALTAAPSLTAIGSRLRYDWIVGYLLNPEDLRPNLGPSMPRLPLTKQDARDVATYLAGLTHGKAPSATELGDPQRGRATFEAKECQTCHRMSGAGLAPAGKGEGQELREAVMLAPDLSHTRQRFQPEALVAWIRNPIAHKPDTKMPETPMTAEEAADIAAFLLRGRLETPPTAPPVELPARLERPVSYDEVATRVFDKTCRHCHGDPDAALGDGGPGNTGGFGYPGRRLQLTSYERLLAGSVDDDGKRQSVFRQDDDGRPYLVRALLARHEEIAGRPDPKVVGMPLGLPPVPLEDIALLDSWIAQGRPR